VLCESYPVKIERMGINDTFGKSGEAKKLMEYYKITSKDIVEKISSK
jgi:transketolase